MPRIYSNYTPTDFENISELAKELGFTPSALQRYAMLLFMDKGETNTTSLNSLVDKMFENIKQIKPECTFIVSALLPDEWPSLSRSTKGALSTNLYNYIKKNPDNYEIYSRTAGQANVYRKK